MTVPGQAYYIAVVEASCIWHHGAIARDDVLLVHQTLHHYQTRVPICTQRPA